MKGTQYFVLLLAFFVQPFKISGLAPSPLLLTQPRGLHITKCKDPFNGNSTVPSSGDEDYNLVAKKCAADILSLMADNEQANTVNATRAEELRSCLKYLVAPQVPQGSFRIQSSGGLFSSLRRNLQSNVRTKTTIERAIRWPPAAVRELAKIAMEWAGEPQALYRELGADLYPVPNVEGSNADKCQLTKYSCGKRFARKEVNEYLGFLFEAIAELAPSVGLNVSISRYDLFHGHLFTAYASNRLGILFHSREYPEYNEKKFPYNLGYCQAGSELPYDDSMNLRNVLWLAPLPSCTGHVCSNKWLASGSLTILDARPDGVIFRELVPEWVDVVRTIYEADFGNTVLDINYMGNANSSPGDHIFLT